MKLTRAVLVGVLLVSVAGCWWAQPGFNSHRTGFNPHEGAITSANAGSLEVDWATPLDAGTAEEIVRSRAGLVHVLTGSSITSIDPHSGDVEWTAEVGSGLSSDPTLVTTGDSVLVPTYRPTASPHGCLRRFDLVDGTDRGCIEFGSVDASAKVGSWVEFVTVVSGQWVVSTMLYGTTGGYGSWLSVTNVTDPSRSWDAPMSDVPQEIFSNPVVVGSEVLTTMTFSDHSTVLQRWPLSCPARSCVATTTPLAIPIATRITASADGSRLALLGYGGNEDPDLEVVDIATGDTLWTADLGDNNFPHPDVWPTWTPESLIVPAFPVDSQPEAPVRRFPAGGCGDNTCTPTWTHASPDALNGQIAAAADILVFGTGDQSAVVLPVACSDPCEPLYTHDAHTWSASPIITDGRIITTDHDGMGNFFLIALRPAG